MSFGGRSVPVRHISAILGARGHRLCRSVTHRPTSANMDPDRGRIGLELGLDVTVEHESANYGPSRTLCLADA